MMRGLRTPAAARALPPLYYPPAHGQPGFFRAPTLSRQSWFHH
ncbi:hypothetical protein SR858_09195 [Duganella zoogloeoides]|uniref:Uncharacterized protein n=1 Tax=Duganella zoogloeoides TaxID=75659 RepID=A0ABZ0Y394_9BURK|nr:hypothetical protein [Duganella zoogloeoides]WQH06480.1 hypothetical protein SR858_09195 [Duganella zoogloeoides]